MSLDDDADEGAGELRPPLPPDDRLWRHPSELRVHGPAGTPVLTPAREDRPAHRSGSWGVVAVAAVAGAVLAAGLLAISGQMDGRVVERPVVEKVAVAPIVSTPMLREETGVQAVVRRLQPSIVRLELTGDSGASSGSGVVFRDDGMILTSGHLVDDADQVRVRLSDGRRLPATVVGIDPLTDLAVVDIDADGLPVAVLGSAKGVEVGSTAMAVGCPHGDAGATVSTGIISATGRTLGSGGMTLHGLLQTDAPQSPASSGGALVNTSGAVIGIVTAFDDDEKIDDADRYGFATPIDLAHRVALQLISSGKARHGWLGVEGVDLDPGAADRLGVGGGAMVRGVERGSPADDAGLGDQDVITEVDGTPVQSMPGLAVEMREHDPGDQVEVGYWRDGQYHRTEVTVGERPEGPGPRTPASVPTTLPTATVPTTASSVAVVVPVP